MSLIFNNSISSRCCYYILLQANHASNLLPLTFEKLSHEVCDLRLADLAVIFVQLREDFCKEIVVDLQRGTPIKELFDFFERYCAG